MRFGAAVFHRFGHGVGLVPYQILAKVPTIRTQSEGDHPGNAYQVFGFDAGMFAIGGAHVTDARYHVRRLQGLPGCPALFRFGGQFVAAFAFATPVRIAQIEPEGAVFSQDPAHLPKYLHQVIHVFFGAGFQTDLPAYPIVAQSVVGWGGHNALHRAVWQGGEEAAVIALQEFPHGYLPSLRE